MADELKPCPFCGCTTIKPDNNGDEDWFRCDWCGATSGWNGDTPENEAKSAADWWNTRTPAVDDLCAAVKPLEWQCPHSLNVFITQAMGLQYHISNFVPDDPKPFRLKTPGMIGFPSIPFWTLDEAKAAAQADYERRVLSAVTLRPASEVRREALEEAARVADEIAEDFENDAGCYDLAPAVRHTSAAIRALIEEDKA